MGCHRGATPTTRGAAPTSSPHTAGRLHGAASVVKRATLSFSKQRNGK